MKFYPTWNDDKSYSLRSNSSVLCSAVRLECVTTDRGRVNQWPNIRHAVEATVSIYRSRQHCLANRAVLKLDEHSLVPTIYQLRNPMEHRCGFPQPSIHKRTWKMKKTTNQNTWDVTHNFVIECSYLDIMDFGQFAIIQFSLWSAERSSDKSVDVIDLRWSNSSEHFKVAISEIGEGATLNHSIETAETTILAEWFGFRANKMGIWNLDRDEWRAMLSLENLKDYDVTPHRLVLWGERARTYAKHFSQVRMTWNKSPVHVSCDVCLT